MRVSRQTAHKWWRRYQEAGRAGLADRLSRPRRCPTKTPAKVERRLVELRRRHQLGPARLAPRAGVPASTLHRVWVRHGVSRLSDLERRSGRVVRRIETTRPGELVHVDIKKQAKIPKGGGWRVRGVEVKARKNGKAGRPRLGYAYVHSAIDAHSRLAYSEIHGDEQATTAIAFWRRARAFFSSYGIEIERVMSDNGSCYKAKAFTHELVSAGIVHTRTTPYCPQTNGKIERYNRTLLNEWAYARPYRSEALAPGPSTRGSTCTTIIATTRQSGDPPSAESTTWLDPTARARALPLDRWAVELVRRLPDYLHPSSVLLGSASVARPQSRRRGEVRCR